MKFENAFANGPYTALTFRSILALAYPFEFVQREPLAPNANLISEVMEKEEVRTAAIHSNPYLSAFYGYNRGWSYFQDFLPKNASEKVEIGGVFKSLIKEYLPNTIWKFGHSAMTFIGFKKPLRKCRHYNEKCYFLVE